MLRPRITRVPRQKGELRILFCLMRPDRTRKVYTQFDLYDRAYASSGCHTRGFSFDFKVFN